MGWRRVVAGVGRGLILMGTLILLFVVYQLWGTGLAEARDQRTLRDSFDAQLESAGVDVPEVDPADATTVTFDTAPPSTPDGDAVAIIKIPRIGLEKTVVEGVGVPDLKKGPGHYPGTALPGQPGNAAIAGHRTTYGAPFNRIDELQVGDPILVTTLQGRFRYEVSEQLIVSPSDVQVLDASDDDRLTLTTCNPKYSARQRLVVVASLIGEAAPEAEAPPEPDIFGETAALNAGGGLSGASAANGPAVLWGLLSALVLTLIWAGGRWWRRWPSYLIGTPIFLVVLFVFFENFAVLLPANI